MNEEAEEEELFKLTITIDEDGWVNWLLPNGMSGNDPLQEFLIILEQFKDEFYEEKMRFASEEDDDE